jgi:hypothetical protein
MKETRSVEKTVRDIRRHTRKKYSSEETIRIVLEGLRVVLNLTVNLLKLKGNYINI